MKVRITNKQAKENYNNIITIGYCEAQDLLALETPIWYTCGIYGWNSDNYHIDNNTLISTGYRPIDGIRPSYNLVKKYNDKAREIRYNNTIKYEEKMEQTNKLLQDFVKEVLA